ncbi:MAG: DUF3332 family protein [Bdellovibrionaceae bacterium]|nr:DUF3332 family protein [Pseudobdellovibrionaceae bacterium]
MKNSISKLFFYVSSLLACTVIAFTTGCASGGFKITRQYAGFVNKQFIILRIILYIFTTVVFAVTMIIDMVIFNTIDFWEGRVSEGHYEYNKEGRTFQVHHEVIPGSLLKRSTIKVLSDKKELLQTIVLLETNKGEIEMSVDGQLRTRVRDINSLPVASIYDQKGSLVEDQILWVPGPVSVITASQR